MLQGNSGTAYTAEHTVEQINMQFMITYGVFWCWLVFHLWIAFFLGSAAGSNA